MFSSLGKLLRRRSSSAAERASKAEQSTAIADFFVQVTRSPLWRSALDDFVSGGQFGNRISIALALDDGAEEEYQLRRKSTAAAAQTAAQAAVPSASSSASVASAPAAPPPASAAAPPSPCESASRATAAAQARRLSGEWEELFEAYCELVDSVFVVHLADADIAESEVVAAVAVLSEGDRKFYSSAMRHLVAVSDVHSFKKLIRKEVRRRERSDIRRLRGEQAAAAAAEAESPEKAEAAAATAEATPAAAEGADQEAEEEEEEEETGPSAEEIAALQAAMAGQLRKSVATRVIGHADLAMRSGG